MTGRKDYNEGNRSGEIIKLKTETSVIDRNLDMTLVYSFTCFIFSSVTLIFSSYEFFAPQ